MDRRQLLQMQAHRPAPLPKWPWVMQQVWKDLLFLHYRLPQALLRDKLPRQLTLDTYDGDAWVTLTPMKMRNVRLRGLPPVPGAANFLELNLRTYVKRGGQSGIHFFSLDTSSILSAMGARMVALPYFPARMSMQGDTNFVFNSERRQLRQQPPARLDVEFKPKAGTRKPSPLEAWLAERYILFQRGLAGTVIAIEIHHLPWDLRGVDVTVRTNTIATPLGINLPTEASLAHYAARQEVLIWPPGLA
jgi:uncharacterized protein